MLPVYYFYFVAFIFGLCVGSFLNVCIFRIPADKSIISPGSMCSNCGKAIKFYDNIPVLSFLLLKGRCRFCGASISLRYPLIEILGGLFGVAVVWKFGPTLTAGIYFSFIATLLAVSFIDIDHRIIPDVISLPGIPIFFLASLALPQLTYGQSLLGILAGGGSLFAVAWTYNLLTGKDGMGGGDIKLLAMIGALLGWKGVLFTIFMASAAGTVIGIIVMLYTKKGMKLAVPFGPFLSLGAVIYIFFGTQIIQWYYGLLI